MISFSFSSYLNFFDLLSTLSSLLNVRNWSVVFL